MNKDQSPIILAFSGGLDTSFCVPWLKENYGRDVITATIDTGGIDEHAAQALEERAMALGAIEHVLIDCKQDFFDDAGTYWSAHLTNTGRWDIQVENDPPDAALEEVPQDGPQPRGPVPGVQGPAPGRPPQTKAPLPPQGKGGQGGWGVESTCCGIPGLPGVAREAISW